MQFRGSLILLGLSSLLPVLGCAVDSPQGRDEVGHTEQPIINGTKDMGHPAVVAILTAQSECTGTIILTDTAAKKGYVITAAHCMTDEAPEVIVVGNNYVSGTEYTVIDYKAHEQYNGQNYDFGMVTFQWANNQAAPPEPIPLLTKLQDNMAAGSTVDFVGFGVTSANPNNPGYNNTFKYHVSGQLSGVKPLTIEYNQSNSGAYANNSGTCFGDSGGPALYTVPGIGETMAAVTSYGDQDCTEFGVSSRVSAVEPWIADYIANGGGGGGQTCNDCFNDATSNGGACDGAVSACLNDNTCNSLVQCLNGCQTQPCVDQCAQDYAGGVPKYEAIITCVCDTGCPAECGSESFCGGAPQQCGFDGLPAACQTCFEGACCAQGAACAADQTCVDCVSNEDPDPSCDQNAKATALYDCLGQSCSSECGLGGAGGAGGAGGGGVGGGGAGGAGGGAVGGSGGFGGDGGDGNGNGGDGANGNGNGGDGANGNNNTVVTCGACRVGDARSGSNDSAAFALGAVMVGLFAARRRK